MSNIQFEVAADALRAALAFAKAGLGTGQGLAEKVIRFDVSDGEIQLTASDGDLIASAGAIASVQGNPSATFAVIGKRLVTLLDRSKAAAFQFQIDMENVQISAPDGLIVQLERYDTDLLEFAMVAQKSVIEQLHTPAEQSLVRERLLEALEVCSASTAKSTGRPELNHVELRQGRLLASDNRRVTGVASAAFHSSAKLKIPVPVLGHAIAALKTTPRGAIFFPHETGSHFHLMAPKRFLSFRLTDAVFPAVESSLSERVQVSDTVTIPREAFLGALREVEVGLPQDETLVELGLDEGYLSATAENTLGRQSRKAVPVERTTTDPLSVPVSIDQLVGSLATMRGEKVRLLILTQHPAVLLIDETEDREVATLMPVRAKATQASPGEEPTSTAIPEAEKPEGGPADGVEL